MGHPQNEHYQSIVMYLVDDSVVAGPDSPFPCAAHEPFGGGWSRLLGKELQHCLDTRSNLRSSRAAAGDS